MLPALTICPCLPQWAQQDYKLTEDFTAPKGSLIMPSLISASMQVSLPTPSMLPVGLCFVQTTSLPTHASVCIQHLSCAFLVLFTCCIDWPGFSAHDRSAMATMTRLLPTHCSVQKGIADGLGLLLLSFCGSDRAEMPSVELAGPTPSCLELTPQC